MMKLNCKTNFYNTEKILIQIVFPKQKIQSLFDQNERKNKFGGYTVYRL